MYIIYSIWHSRLKMSYKVWIILGKYLPRKTFQNPNNHPITECPKWKMLWGQTRLSVKMTRRLRAEVQKSIESNQPEIENNPNSNEHKWSLKPLTKEVGVIACWKFLFQKIICIKRFAIHHKVHGPSLLWAELSST